MLYTARCPERIRNISFYRLGWLCFCALFARFHTNKMYIFSKIFWEKAHTIIRNRTVHTQQSNRWQHVQYKWSLWAPAVRGIIGCFSLTCECVFWFLELVPLFAHFMLLVCYMEELLLFCSNITKVFIYSTHTWNTLINALAIVILRVCGNIVFSSSFFCGIGNKQNEPVVRLVVLFDFLRRATVLSTLLIPTHVKCARAPNDKNRNWYVFFLGFSFNALNVHLFILLSRCCN